MRLTSEPKLVNQCSFFVVTNYDFVVNLGAPQTIKYDFLKLCFSIFLDLGEIVLSVVIVNCDLEKFPAARPSFGFLFTVLVNTSLFHNVSEEKKSRRRREIFGGKKKGTVVDDLSRTFGLSRQRFLPGFCSA